MMPHHITAYTFIWFPFQKPSGSATESKSKFEFFKLGFCKKRIYHCVGDSLCEECGNMTLKAPAKKIDKCS